jgi:hypothetical protein
MKPGDLIQPASTHGLCGLSYRAHGIVLEHFPDRPGFKEHVVVRWNNGDIEVEVPAWLEILSENKFQEA